MSNVSYSTGRGPVTGGFSAVPAILDVTANPFSSLPGRHGESVLLWANWSGKAG
eukprot:CAMPEP_0174732974 /NCGR_PEP_ID=MMETSP1094-20130205/60400_1 /TAXON_ID=156173 /ORGANISM="Chrysochromulina brevifilum, Strain UTEX LB 985" /LENGTH=53 /DNA_ID=CAMNT_0015935559 /DNA_START=47 /DNA_END=208 /DNA_ORIENTATION=-